MALTSTRLAVLGAFLLASIVSVIAVGQRELSRNKPETAEISVAVYPDQGMLFPAGYHYRNQARTMKTSLAFQQKQPSVRLGAETGIARL